MKFKQHQICVNGQKMSPFADIIHRYPCYDKEKTTAGMWSYFKMLVKPDGQRNLICILCAKMAKVTLLTRSKSSTASQQQHLRNKHKQMFEDLQTESLHSKASSVQVKKCKEDNAIALAEAVRTGTIDKFVHRHPAHRMKKEKKVEVDREFALYLLQHNRPNNMANDQAFKRWCNSLNETYDLPSAQEFKVIQDDLTAEVDQKIKQLNNTVTKVIPSRSVV